MRTLEKSLERALQTLDRTILTGLVRRAKKSDSVELIDWHVQIMKPSLAPATDGVYRLAGIGWDRGSQLTWSLVLKVIHLGASEVSHASSEEGHELYWKREALAYQSGLLDDLPGGITVARCYGVTEQPDGSVWLWLEDVEESLGPEWPLEQYAYTAGCLGRFNGAYLNERSMPAYPWLIKSGSPRGLLDHNTGVRDEIADATNWQHPTVRSAFPIPVMERLLRLWDERGPLLDALDRVPHTLCHQDAWRCNMFAPADRNGQRRLVLIDWAFVGRGAIATDAGTLFTSSFSMFGVEAVEPAVFDRTIFEHYLDGLRDAGWRGDRTVARFAFASFCAIKHGCFIPWLADLEDESRHSIWERHSGRPMDEFVHRQAALIYYLLDLADEARTLYDSLRIRPT
jgi:hypothetical protein